MDINLIIENAEKEIMPYLLHHYDSGSNLLELLLIHSRLVARKALNCILNHSLSVDPKAVARAALLHDIGIVSCNAPGIYCTGNEPYIRHGIIGRAMLEPLGLIQEAMVCERHTGSGITAEEIEMTSMPLPVRDMVPVSIIEKLVCYADKFYSKSGDPYKEKSASHIRTSLSRYGSASMMRFDELHKAFG